MERCLHGALSLLPPSKEWKGKNIISRSTPLSSPPCLSPDSWEALQETTFPLCAIMMPIFVPCVIRWGGGRKNIVARIRSIKGKDLSPSSMPSHFAHAWRARKGKDRAMISKHVLLLESLSSCLSFSERTLESQCSLPGAFRSLSLSLSLSQRPSPSTATHISCWSRVMHSHILCVKEEASNQERRRRSSRNLKRVRVPSCRIPWEVMLLENGEKKEREQENDIQLLLWIVCTIESLTPLSPACCRPAFPTRERERERENLCAPRLPLSHRYSAIDEDAIDNDTENPHGQWRR